ncbi:helix-turn-helix domain-containing protein [Pseudorhodoplanes sp.]|uniref:helix-turn-helix domain-containing protein n=1 Tax=Pseudorhodoplanes sp. TaxID=1934341 RepID=UPI003D138A95
MTKISGRQIAAARALADISQQDLAGRARIPLADLLRLESYGAALLPDDAHAEAIRNALDSFGAVFVPEGHGLGAGVRLKFSRQDVKQISRLENEGGPAADDDVP